MSGVTTRTLRHYDELGLLSPKRDKDSLYRLYDEDNVNTLQSILFYRELGYELKEIKDIISESNFDIIESLNEMEDKLESKIESYKKILKTIKDTIQLKKGNIEMSNNKKFEAFKEAKLKENNDKYGIELEEKYDKKFMQQANQKYKNKTESEMNQHNTFTDQMHSVMIQAIKENDSSSELSMKMCEMHKQWLLFYWPTYTKEAHLSLTEMYTQDERFTKYYDNIHPGLAKFLFKAMNVFMSK